MLQHYQGLLSLMMLAPTPKLTRARARSRCRRLGEGTPRVQCNRAPPKLSGLEQALANRVAAPNDLTLQQLCE
jgi:hypothetical protein